MKRFELVFASNARRRAKRRRSVGMAAAPLLLVLVNSCTTDAVDRLSHQAQREAAPASRPLHLTPDARERLIAALPGQMPLVSERTPAPAFLSRAGGSDAVRAQVCLTTAIYYEAASEPDDGQRAVAQVVLNRVRHPAWPDSVCGVVFQGWGAASVCQFTFACDGAMVRVPSDRGWARASRIAREALAGHVFAPVGLAVNYHRLDVSPGWARRLSLVGVFGVHAFYALPGAQGSTRAFVQRAALHEPLPAPRPLTVASKPLLDSDTAPLLSGGYRPTPSDLQPVLAASGAVQPDYVEDGDSQILPRWRDSGKVLSD